MKTNIQLASIHNATTIGLSVYSHCNKFTIAYTDLQLTDRGLDFKFILHYRSLLTAHIEELERGRTSSIAKKIEHKDDDSIYHEVYDLYYLCDWDWLDFIDWNAFQKLLIINLLFHFIRQ